MDVPDGVGGQRTVRFLLRRFPPSPGSSRTLAEHAITRGDRLDLVAATYLGDPRQFWRICDANLAIHPRDLTAPGRIGGTLRIPVPQV
jgi:hypothetical protein